MDRVIVDDNVSAVLALQFKERLEAIEQGGMGKDEEGNVVTVSADQVVTSGTEIGGITIGSTRTAFYAPDVEIPDATKVTVTPLVDSGTKIANIKVDDTLHSIYAPAGNEVTVTPTLVNGTKIADIKVGNTTKTLYAPEVINDGSGSKIDISGKLDAPATAGRNGQVLATNGQGVNYWTDNAGGSGSSVSVTQNLTSGTKIATITVDGNATSLFAPVSSDGGSPVVIEGGGDTPLPLLNSFTLTEDVSSIIISEDQNGNALNIAEGFYIEAEFELATENPARYFNIQIGSSSSDTNVTISSNHILNTSRFTYADVYAKQIAPNRWLVETHTKNAKDDSANGVGTAVGNLGYNNWNGFNDPPALVNRVVISYNTSNFGRNTKIKLYGR